MGVKISKRYSSYKLQTKVFKPFLNFSPNVPHKITFGIFDIFGKVDGKTKNLSYLEKERL